ncbi:MAG: phytoene synthase [Alphaproteobacteria bacterium]|jgi:phytoene synthase
MQEDPTALLRKHGKSFNFARLFLGSEIGIAAARLYRFCRIIDDIADESEDKQEAEKQLRQIKHSISQNQKDHPLIGDFLLLCEEHNIERKNGIVLIEGVSEDFDLQAFETEKEVVQYAYKVAGVVGLMMAPILCAEDQGHRFAIDLGIGMQLTNIARDVMQDAHMNRRYIPGSWINSLSAQDIVSSEGDEREAVQKAISRLLQLAEEYYKSGLAGLYYLPNRNRRAIAVAAYVYRAIGHKLLKQNCNYWQGRVIVSTPRKIQLACQALWDLRTHKLAERDTQHRSELHEHLATITSPEMTS